ncbi:putative pectinesterase/pectinesterase inhibitor 34 [Platanthera guangdongensis]|uniref:Pectinesterase n=1 Tax=Platanthera guangdongensis TaxID=2320717 RepID=A0ABR2MJG0_9ASPA
MEYDRLGSSDSTHSPGCSGRRAAAESRLRRRRWLLLAITSLIFVSASTASVALLLSNNSSHRQSHAQPHRKLTRASFAKLPGAAAAGERDLVHISLNTTLHRVGAALYEASAMAGAAMDPRARAAYDDCMELLDISVDQLSRSVQAISGGGASREDVLTWLSAALTNHDTCSEGFDGVADGYVRQKMAGHLKDLAQLVSNSLAIFSAADRGQMFAGVPIQNRKKRLLLSEQDVFPNWMNPADRRLLQIPAPLIQADFIVSKDGNGTHKTVAEAVKAAPEASSRRFVIYIKAGRYHENIKVSRKKTNLMFVGDGKGKTVITSSRSIYDNYTTYHTATFGIPFSLNFRPTFSASGTGFIMKDMTIENSAGPWKHQAVALRVGADHAVVYRCNIIGYQDTLYVHSQRQFFRECDVYGTVDFIFGNAAVDLSGTNSSFQTFLGRPWKLYSRVVYMMSYIGAHVEPRGWLEWNQTFALDTLYYGEYMNNGPGAAVGKRVQWPGYRVITLPAEAGKFTVANFIFGSSWLPGTGVSFLAGLSF